MNPNSIIEFINVKKQYGENIVLQDFCLEIGPGDFVTVVGSSGCGKTTVLKMVNGLHFPDDGNIYINGRDIMRENHVELRRNIGYAIQGTGLFPHMTVEKNVTFVPCLSRRLPKLTCRVLASKLLHLVGLDPEEMMDRYPEELSGGQQQRVGIARALASEPEILLMDEPFGAVDEITRQQLQEEIQRIHNDLGVTIFFVTHDINEALKLGTRVLVMHEGNVIQYDEPDIIRNRPANEFVERLMGAACA